MKRFYEVWLHMGFCCLTMFAFFGMLATFAQLLVVPLWVYLLACLLSFVCGGFLSAIVITKHEERINK